MTRRRLIQVLGVGAWRSALPLEACGPAAPAATTATSAPAATARPRPRPPRRGADGRTSASANRRAGHGRRRQAHRRCAGRAAHLYPERQRPRSRIFPAADRCTRTATARIRPIPSKPIPATPPGSGGKVDIFTTAFLPLPPNPVDQNPAWQESQQAAQRDDQLQHRQPGGLPGQVRRADGGR